MLIEEQTPIAAASPPSLAFRRALRGVLRSAFLFALVGLLVGLRVLALASLPHILAPGNYVNFQEVVDGLPVPRLLAWNFERIDFLDNLRTLNGASLLLAGLFVFGPLWLLAVRHINPTFRLFGAVIPSASLPETLPAAAETPVMPAPAPNGESTAFENAGGSEYDYSGVQAVSEAEEVTTESTPEAPAPADAELPIRKRAKTRSLADLRPGASSTLATPLEFYGLIKGLTLLLVFGLPLAAFWILVDFPDPGSYRSADGLQLTASGPFVGMSWAMRLVLLGMAFWVGFHRDGAAGDFTRPEWNASRRHWPGLAARGALFGLLAFALCRYGLPQQLEDVLVRLQTWGAFNIATWNWISLITLSAFAAIWFAVGALFGLVTTPALSLRQRATLLAVPLTAWLFALAMQRPLTPHALAVHHDIRPAILKTIPENAQYRADHPATGVPDSREAGAELARQLHLSLGPPPHRPGRTLVMFAQNLPLLAYQNGYTVDGVTPDPASAEKVLQFLKEQNYRTALSWAAIKYLYNVPIMRFDMTSAIAVALLDLTHCPHNSQMAYTLEQMLAVCAATPQNEALLDQWADETEFAFPDRESRRLMGDLYRRMGNPTKALAWYRKAEMPVSFLTRIRSERPMFHTGRIEGVLRLNGSPLAGVQVAVVPVLMNGLPRALESPVSVAQEEILSGDERSASRLFPIYHPNPWHLRWISAAATTDSTGAYHIDNLTEGAYTVLCTLPPDIHTDLPTDDHLHVSHPPRPFTVNYTQPTQSMGTTEIKF